MKNKDNLKDFFDKLPNALMYLGIAFLLIDQFLRNAIKLQIVSGFELHLTIGISVIGLLAFTLSKKIDKVSDNIDKISEKYAGILEVLPSNYSINVFELIKKSRKIRILTLSGTKLGELGDSRLKETLLNIPKELELTILLGNPYSISIITRYEKDEPDTYETGLEGIERRLLMLYDINNQLPKAKQKKICIKVFDNYPTISVIQTDNDIYSVVYGYKLRGGDCPKVHSNIHGEYGKFLIKHFQEVEKCSISLEDWIKINQTKKD